MRSADPLHGIAVFLSVAQHLSFTKAAESLGLSRPTVSTQIDQLERRLGVRLLHRSTRRLSLSQAGEAFRAGLADVTDRVAEAERSAIRHQETVAGRLRITAPPDLGAMYLIPMIAQFAAQNPEIEIDLNLSNTAVHLIENRFDLALRGTLEVDDSLVTRKIGRSPIVICAAPEYLARFGEPTLPEDLAHHRCVHASHLRSGRVWEMGPPGDRRRIAIRPHFEVNDGVCLGQAALLGMGVCLLPAFIVGEHLRAGRLVPVLKDWPVADVPLHAVYPDNRYIAKKVKKFVAFLAAEFRRHPDLGAA